MLQAYVRPRDLLASFEPDGSILVRSTARGAAAELDAFAVGLLSSCSEPMTRATIVAQYGADAGVLFDQLVALELLVPPAQVRATPVMFGNFAGIDLHRAMLADKVRLRAYHAAIQATVRKGDVVIDCGAGSGILSVMAAQAGAKKVYAVEATEFARVVKQVAADNGLAKKIEVIQEDFATVELPRRARVLVTETFGAWVLAEGALPDLYTCMARNLELDGVSIPRTFSLYLSPMKEAPAELMRPFVGRCEGVDLSCLRVEALGRAAQQVVPGSAVGPASFVGRFPLRSELEELTAEVTVQGPCEALCAWFTLELTGELTLSTSPDEPTTSWKQTVLPVSLPAGQHRLELVLKPAPEDRRTLLIEVDGVVRQEIRAR
ncbi:MAG: 50S ribosomal protein L11 methyltransferase [Myxococcota bacterium]